MNSILRAKLSNSIKKVVSANAVHEIDYWSNRTKARTEKTD
jgi:hypothetical protein